MSGYLRLQKWFQNDPKMAPKWSQNYPQIVPKRLQNWSRSRLGGLLALVALFVPLFWPPGSLLERSWEPFGELWGDLGGVWGASGALLEPSWSKKVKCGTGDRAGQTPGEGVGGGVNPSPRREEGK